MNTKNMDDNELTSALAREADRFSAGHGADLSMDRVMARAGEIRRGRRMRASMVMAAVVLAIAVPVGITVISDDGPGSTKEPSPAAPVSDEPITIEGLKAGAEPQDGYLHAGTLHDGDTEIPLGKGGEPRALARLDGGFLVARQSLDGSGNLEASFVGEDRSGVGAWPIEGGFAVSAGGNVGAFAKPDGTVVVIQDKGAEYLEPGRIPVGSGFAVVAVQGEDCSPDSPDGGCTIFATSRGEVPANWEVSPGREPQLRFPALHNLTDLNPDGLAAGITEVHEDLTTCSAVLDNGDNQLWNTCTAANRAGKRVSTFSPDGEHLLATGSVGSGMGDAELAVLDAKTGKVVLDLAAVDQAVITTMVWEDDEHVLAVVTEKGQWAVLRIGLDGNRELALPTETGTDDLTPPYLLPEG